MGYKVAIIDVDGEQIILDTTARFAVAARAEQEALRVGKSAREAKNLKWQVAWNPDLLVLDTLAEGAVSALELVFSEYDFVYFLTARPDSLRNATIAQLVSYLPFEEWRNNLWVVFTKPEDKKWLKTADWKAGMVVWISDDVQKNGPSPITDLIFVDDEEQNRRAVEDRVLYIMKGQSAGFGFVMRDSLPAVEAYLRAKRTGDLL